MSQEEQWKPIPSHPHYQASSYGRIRKTPLQGKEGAPSTFISQMLTGKPQYYYCNLQGDNGRKLHRVHRLIAQSFIPNPDNLPIVKHKDNNPLNNVADNLIWAKRERGIKQLDIPADEEFISLYTKRLSGWDNWSLTNNCPRKFPGSIQDNLYWYPSEKYIYKKVYISRSKFLSLVKKGYTYTQIYNREFPGVYTLAYNGKLIKGTKRELRKRTGLSDAMINRRMLHTKTTYKGAMIRYYKINGKIKTKAAWCREFGIVPSHCSNVMSRENLSFKEYLQYIGYDISSLRITPIQ